MGFAGCFLGAVIARALLQTVGATQVIGVLAGFRAIQCIWWGLMPSPKAETEKEDDETIIGSAGQSEVDLCAKGRRDSDQTLR